MIRCSLQAISRIPSVVDYTFYDESGLKLLETKGDVIQTGIASAFRELPIIPYTLSLIDADGNERFSLKKKTLVTQTAPAFTLECPQGSVDFLEDKEGFSLRNTSFYYKGVRYDLTGFVRARTFYIKCGDDVLATFRGKLIPGGKEYAMEISSDALPLAVYLGAAIVLDVYFHSY